jgi:hypothetical protein
VKTGEVIQDKGILQRLFKKNGTGNKYKLLKVHVYYNGRVEKQMAKSLVLSFIGFRTLQYLDSNTVSLLLLSVGRKRYNLYYNTKFI